MALMGQEPNSISEEMKVGDRELSDSDSVIVVENPIYGSCMSIDKDDMNNQKGEKTDNANYNSTN